MNEPNKSTNHAPSVAGGAKSAPLIGPKESQWYLAEKEKEWKSTQYGIKSTEDKIKSLEELREKILNSH